MPRIKSLDPIAAAIDQEVAVYDPSTDETYETTIAEVVALATPSGGSGQTTYDVIVAPSGGDYTSLSAALAVVASGARIFIKAGSYNESGGTFSQTNLTIVGAGSETVLLTLAANLVFSGGYLNISHVTIDCGTSYQISLTGNYDTLTNNHFKGSYTTYFVTSASYAGFSQNIFEATGGSATVLFSSGRHRVVNNHFIAPHKNGAGIWLGGDVTFTGNFVYRQANNFGGGPLLYIGGEWTTVTGNAFYCGLGALITSDFRCAISNNTAYQVGGTGIQAVDGCSVTGNTIHMAYQGQGIYVNSSSDGYGCVVSGNHIYGNSTPLAGAQGVYVNGGNKAIISSNVIVNVATGVSVAAAATKTLISGNSFNGNTTDISDAGTGTVTANNIT